MHHTSLIEILRTFNREELKKFEDFVSSPYHNKKSAVTNFYKQIKKYGPEFTSQRLKNEKLWSVLHPDKKFSYGVFKNMIYDLTHLAEKFLVLEYHQRDFVHSRYELLDSLLERQIKNLFKSTFKFVIDEMENCYNKKNNDAGSYHYYMSKMYLLKWYFNNQYEKNNSSPEDFNIHSVFQAGVMLNMIFHTSINAINFSTDHIYNKDENLLLTFTKNAESNNLISQLIDSIKPVSIEMHNNLDAFHKYFRSVSDRSSVEKYFEFKEALSLNASNLSNPDKYILYSGLRNSLRKLIPSDINKSREVLDIIKLKIKDEVMLNPDGLLDLNEFLSCIDAACDMDDGDFIANFSEKFIDYVPNAAKENMLNYSNAHLYFTKNDFVKSLETLHKINLDTFIMKYYLKNLLVMNYYELNDYNSYFLSIDSYNHFLNKNKLITEDWKRDQKSFCSFINKLFKLKESRYQVELTDLKNEIARSSVSKKQWLLRKIEQLEIKAKEVILRCLLLFLLDPKISF